MKIIFLIYGLSGGGAEWQCLLQAREMMRKGYNVKLYTLSSDIDYVARILDNPEKLSIYSFNIDKKNTRLKRYLIYLKIIKHLRKELSQDTVIYSWLEFSHFLSAVACVGRPAKLVWGLRNANLAKEKEPHIYKLAKINKLLSKVVDGAVGNSDRVLDYYLYTLRYKIHNKIVIFNTICSKKFYQKTIQEKNAIRKKLKLDGDTYVILSLSRVVPFKNIDQIILALKIILDKKDFLKIKLLIVGEGDCGYVTDLQILAVDIGVSEYICWLGRREDTENYYNICDLYVLASTSGEGASNSLAEAVQCGATAISARIGEAERVLPESYLIDGDGAEAIANKVINIMSGNVKEKMVKLPNSHEAEMDKLEQFLLSC